MTNRTYIEEKRTIIKLLQKRIRMDQVKLFSLVTLAIIPLMAVLAADVIARSDASDPLGGPVWFMNELSLKSILLMAAIWIVPLSFIIQSKWNRISEDRDLLVRLRLDEAARSSRE